MTIQLSTAVRNARLNAITSTIGASAILAIYTGLQPANCAASETGTLLVTFSLASTWMAAASGGSEILDNLPLSATASAAGTAAHWRIYDSTDTTCHAQGTITGTGGGGDMTIDNTTIASGQTVNVTGFTLTDGNA